MKFEIYFTERADKQMDTLAKSKRTVYKAVCKILGYMETNLRHPSLNTHEYGALKGPNNEKIFESYAQNKTPGAYRIFWYYGPGKREITVINICPHP